MQPSAPPYTSEENVNIHEEELFRPSTPPPAYETMPRNPVRLSQAMELRPFSVDANRIISWDDRINEISESKRSNTCCKLWSILCGLYHLIYFIAGIVILGFGIYLKLKIPKFLTFSDLKIKNLEEYVLDFSIITICIGAIVMTIAFFGCYGSMTKNVCMVRTYAALVILILISMICGTIVIFIHKENVTITLQEVLNKSMSKYGKEDHHPFNHKNIWNVWQKGIQCCGAKNYTDWSDVPPKSCDCLLVGIGNNDNCIRVQYKNENRSIWKRGCLEAVANEITTNIGVVIGSAIAFVLVLVAGVANACLQAKNIELENTT